MAIKFVDKRSVKDLREVSPKQQITFRQAGLNHVNLRRQPRYVNFAKVIKSLIPGNSAHFNRLFELSSSHTRLLQKNYLFWTTLKIREVCGSLQNTTAD